MFEVSLLKAYVQNTLMEKKLSHHQMWFLMPWNVIHCILLGLRSRRLVRVLRQYESQWSPLDTINMSQDSHIVHFQFASDLWSVEKDDCLLHSSSCSHVLDMLTLIHIWFEFFNEYF